MTKKSILLLAVLLLIVTAGCSKQQAARPPQEVAVKAMQVIQKSTPVTYEFVGEIVAKDEVKIQSRVSGNISKKLVKGGDTVRAGQPLFEIDPRQYEAAVSDAKGEVAKAQATLSNTRRDVLRYKSLADQGGIAAQTLDTNMSKAEQEQALVLVAEAKLTRAHNDLADTVIVSPVDGRIGVGELSVGAFVQSGSTLLATVSTVNPVQVRFSMSENEYLKFARIGNTPDAWGQKLTLTLSDGSHYPLPGRLEQVDRGMANQTGTLTMKAVFDNPQQFLVPGMFARILAIGETREGALLIPQRAAQEMLGKTFVTVATSDNKAEVRPVKLGPKIGNMQIVEEGLSQQDIVVVEGFTKAQQGSSLKVTMMTPDDLIIPGTK